MQGDIHRFQYIDVLRGIMIFLVVYYHVKGRFNIETSFVDNLLMCVRMHVFFFISGFVAYKPFNSWNRELIVNKFINKVRCLLIPTILFYCIYYLLLFDYNPISRLIEYGWKGYWFTIALFGIFVLYYVISYLTRNNNRINLLVLVSICFVDIFIFHITDKKEIFWNVSGFGAVLQYLPFFFTGLFFRKYFDDVLLLLKKSWTLIILFILTAFVFLVLYKTNSLPVKFYSFVSCWLLRLTYTLLIVNVFVKYRQFFDKKNICNNTLAYLGKHSLEIYLIHYFYVYYSDNIFQLLNSYDIIITKRLFIFVLSILVVIACLCVSFLIRKNRFLRGLVFPVR